MKDAFITLLIVGIIHASANDLRLVKERIRFLENRVNSESKFRHEDYSEIIYRLDEIDKVLNTSLDSRARVSRYDELPKETGETSSKAFEHLKEDFIRIRKAFGEVKAKMARSRREIPILGNNLKAVQEEIDNYCKIGLNKTDKVISRLETNTLMISKVSAKQIAVYDKLENVNQLKEITLKLEQVKQKTDDMENKTAISNGRVDTIAANVEINKVNLERVYSLVTELSTNVKPLLRQVSSIEETSELIVSEVSKKHIKLLNEINENSSHDNTQLKDIVKRLGQVKKQVDDNENSKRVDAIAAIVEENKVNIERVYSLVLSILFKQRSCNEILNNGFTLNGAYNLRQGHMVYCDQTTDGGGWIVFQRRLDGEEDFYRNWADYKNCFGDLNGEFWLGNEHLSLLTASGEHELRIELEDFDGNSVYAKYSKFKIYPEDDNYKLEVSGYSGTAGDSLAEHNGRMFSTFDRDNDHASTSNCAVLYHGAWWYASCYLSNLNGQYFEKSNKGIMWLRWKYSSLKIVEMKFR
ncbi:fibrinogen C domain-containing protein 1-A-like [Ruditapes philippinarum]|uniref:fibrinogen C domain-containing protein 1-A-like n=1 Tax=Ruditapes philippinarum TaxID=129788 RepID=UPI00295B87FC|nr:fibrinogen C domain-containing protein 1-A-like [Ruditapes philippinarum]